MQPRPDGRRRRSTAWSGSGFDAGAAKRGQVLFSGTAKCSTCHVPPVFTEPGTTGTLEAPTHRPEHRHFYQLAMPSPKAPAAELHVTGSRYDCR